jgi:hypothetical protein
MAEQGAVLEDSTITISAESKNNNQTLPPPLAWSNNPTEFSNNITEKPFEPDS